MAGLVIPSKNVTSALGSGLIRTVDAMRRVPFGDDVPVIRTVMSLMSASVPMLSA
jgi:hypothetical protein